MNKVLTAVMMAGVALATTAQAAGPSIGTIADARNAVVSRDGRLLRAVPNMRLMAGDRVITRSGGSAKVAMASCRSAMGASSMITVSGRSCADASEVSLDRGRAGYAGYSSAQDGNSTGVILLVLAGGAAVAGIVAGASGGNSSSP